MTAPRTPVSDPLFGAAWAAAGLPQPSRTWNLPVINALAAGAVIGGVAYRLWEAHLPAGVLREEAVLIALGVVLTGVAVAVRMSRLATSLAGQLPIMAAAATLAVLVLGVAGKWLGDDLPPLAAVSFAVVLLQFDAGLHSRHFGYVFAIAILAIGLLWAYAVTQLMVSISAVVIWTLLLVGIGLLALLTSRSVQRDVGAQVARQSSLLATLSDLGEGLLITENGRFVAGNDAYVKLTGYSRAELESLPSLIELAPEDERERLAANLARRLSGGEAPPRYRSAMITKSGRRIQVDVAIHRVATRRNQLLTLVSDISERLRAEEAEREMETRFRTLFQQAQAGMAFTTLDGHITTVNPAFCELVGYSESELRTLSLLDITHPDDVGALQEAMHGMLAGEEEGRRIEKRYTRKDGEHVWAGPDDAPRPRYGSEADVFPDSHGRHPRPQARRGPAGREVRRHPGPGHLAWVGKGGPRACSRACAVPSTGSSRSTGRWTPQREAMHFVTSWKRPGRDTTAFEATARERGLPARRGACRAGLGGWRTDRDARPWRRLDRHAPSPPSPSACMESSAFRCAAAGGSWA